MECITNNIPIPVIGMQRTVLQTVTWRPLETPQLDELRLPLVNLPISQPTGKLSDEGLCGTHFVL